MGNSIFFWIFSILTVLGALGVVLVRHPIYAVLSLVVSFFGLSGLFALLGAYFVAVIQILIYAGAILVLFLFVVMLLDLAPEALLRTRAGTLRIVGTCFGLFFLWELVQAVRAGPLDQALPAALTPTAAAGPPAIGTTAAVGKLLFTTYALPFEVASLLLLVGVIGAVVLAKKTV